MRLIDRKLKNKKSVGADGVPVFLLKRIFPLIISPLAHLINFSFETGTFPDKLKIGKVVPIFKKKDLYLLENYRPVTLPFSFSKVFEYAYLDRLGNFLDNILSHAQHGFRVNKSTATATFSLYDELIDSIDRGEAPVAIFCDMSRAFDCVNHAKLIDILDKYGVRSAPLSWIRSFLAGAKNMCY